MFKGLGNLGNIAGMLQQAKEMGPKMEQAQQRLKEKTVEGTACGGMVKVDADGQGTVTRVEIDPELAAKNDLEMILDLLPAAINQASGKAKELYAEEMKSVTGDLPLPGDLGDTLKNLLGQ